MVGAVILLLMLDKKIHKGLLKSDHSIPFLLCIQCLRVFIVFQNRRRNAMGRFVGTATNFFYFTKKTHQRACADGVLYLSMILFL
jgi:hypothetical protein